MLGKLGREALDLQLQDPCVVIERYLYATQVILMKVFDGSLGVPQTSRKVTVLTVMRPQVEPFISLLEHIHRKQILPQKQHIAIDAGTGKQAREVEGWGSDLWAFKYHDGLGYVPILGPD